MKKVCFVNRMWWKLFKSYTWNHFDKNEALLFPWIMAIILLIINASLWNILKTGCHKHRSHGNSSSMSNAFCELSSDISNLSNASDVDVYYWDYKTMWNWKYKCSICNLFALKKYVSLILNLIAPLNWSSPLDEFCQLYF